MGAAVAKIKRWTARHVDQAALPVLKSSIISFSFDDCPKSAIKSGLPLLEAQGWRATIYVACGLCDTTNHLGLHMSEADIVETYKRGHEIADHTYSHMSANEANVEEFLADIAQNQAKLNHLGIPKSRHFAYPFGHVTPRLKQTLGTQFETLRGVVSPKNEKQDANLLSAMRVYSNDSIELALAEIEKAKVFPKWLHLFTHDVRNHPSAYGCTEVDFEKIVTAVADSGLDVMTVDQAYNAIMEGA